MDCNWIHPLLRLSYFNNFLVYEGCDIITLQNKDMKIILKMPEMRPGEKLILAMMPEGGKMTPKLVLLCKQPSTEGGTNEVCPICLQTAEEMKDNGIAVDRVFMKPKSSCMHVACRECYQLAIKHKLKKNTGNIDLSEFCFLCNY